MKRSDDIVYNVLDIFELIEKIKLKKPTKREMEIYLSYRAECSNFAIYDLSLIYLRTLEIS